MLGRLDAGAVALISLLLQSGCSEPTALPSPSHRGPESEDRGTLLAESADPPSSALAWSADGAEVLYIVPSPTPAAPSSIQATRVSDRSTRVVAVVGVVLFAVVHALAAAPTGVFYVGRDSTQGPTNLYEASGNGGPGRVIAEGIDVGRYYGEETVVVAADGGRLAYAAGGSVFVYDVAGGTARLVAAGYPLAFSPDASHLLCLRYTSTGEFTSTIVSLDSGVGTDAPLGLPPIQFPALVRWGAAGIRVLFTNNRELGVQDVATGVTTWLLTSAIGAWLQMYGWDASSDLARVAFWTIPTPISAPALDNQVSLQIADGGGALSRQAHAAAQGYQIALSPDGRRVAYFFGSRIYVKDLP